MNMLFQVKNILNHKNQGTDNVNDLLFELPLIQFNFYFGKEHQYLKIDVFKYKEVKNWRMRYEYIVMMLLWFYQVKRRLFSFFDFEEMRSLLFNTNLNQRGTD